MAVEDIFAAPAGQESGRILTLGSVINAVWSSKWLVLACILIASANSAYQSLQRVPTYTATARLLIEPAARSLLDLNQMFGGRGANAVDATQLELLRSRPFIQRVLAREQLMPERSTPSAAAAALMPAPEPAQFSFRAWWNGWTVRLSDTLRSLIGRTPTQGEDPSRLPESVRDQRLQGRINFVRGSMRIVPVSGTNLVDISWRSGDRVFATRMANGIAEEFVAYHLDTQTRIARQASDYAGAQIDRLREQLLNDDVELARLGEQLGIDTNTVQTGTQAPQNSGQLAVAQADRGQKQSHYRMIQNSSPRNLTEVANSAQVRTARQSVERLDGEYADLRRRFTDQHPEVQALLQDLEDSRRRLAAAEQTAYSAELARARSAYRAAQEFESRLRQEFNPIPAAADPATREETLAYQDLRQRVDSQREMLDTFLERRGALELQSDAQASPAAFTIRVVDPATLPNVPSGGNLTNAMFSAALIGLAIGIALALVIDFVDSTLRSPEDVTRRLNMTTLATISSLTSARKAGKSGAYSYGGKGNSYVSDELDADVPPHFIVDRAPRSTIAEEYRSLRTALLLSTAAGAPRTLLVTSSDPGEGKTTTAANLAISLAQTGKKVLIVDADMRRPRLSSIFDVGDGEGLSNYLAGSAHWRALVQETSIQNLWLLGSGPIPPNPAELFASDLDEQFLKESVEHFDMVVLDSPPVMTVVDPVILAPEVDGVLLVARARRTPHHVVAKAKARLESVDAKLLGLALNGVETPRGSYYSSAYRYRKSGTETPLA